MEVRIEPFCADVDRCEGQTIEKLRRSAIKPIAEPSAWLEQDIKRSILTTSVDKILNWGRKTSLWTETAFTACCAFEFKHFFVSLRYRAFRHGNTAQFTPAFGSNVHRRHIDLEDGTSDQAYL
jgi:hypothetical protein